MISGPPKDPMAKKKWCRFITIDSLPGKSWMRRGLELDSINPPPIPMKVMPIRLSQNQSENPNKMRLAPMRRQPSIRIELFLMISEIGPPMKTAVVNPSWSRAVSVPAWRMVRSSEERIAGNAVPRKVLDIPRKLMETKAPDEIIHRLWLTLPLPPCRVNHSSHIALTV
jgi:hypothetical protein